MMSPIATKRSFCTPILLLPSKLPSSSRSIIGGSRRVGSFVIQARDRSKNRKPLQKGRNLSIEAIQTVQSLKRAAAAANQNNNLDAALLDSKFRRLLKLDMIAVLRELIRQNQCQLSLLVFEDVRKEYWYKPQALLYAELISVLGTNGLFEQVELIFSILKTEKTMQAKPQDVNSLLGSFISFNMTGHAIDFFHFIKSVGGCELERSTFRTLINHLESKGETGLSESIKQEALEYFGELYFLEEEQEEDVTTVS